MSIIVGVLLVCDWFNLNITGGNLAGLLWDGGSGLRYCFDWDFKFLLGVFKEIEREIFVCF